MTALPDTDGDGLPNVIERDFGSDPTKVDTDGDGLSDREELDAHTDPTKRDTDADGLGDRVEVLGRTDPNEIDTDHDGRSDGLEVAEHTDARTNERGEYIPSEDARTIQDKAHDLFGTGLDSDLDGIPNADERDSPWHTNVLDADSDGDGLSDAVEMLGGTTKPNSDDTDNDNVDDGTETAYGMDPRDPHDPMDMQP